MRHDPPERGEIDECLRDRHVHERARRSEVEFDLAGWVEGWVGGDEGVVRSAEAGHSGVYEYWGWVGEGVEVGEEGTEGGGCLGSGLRGWIGGRGRWR